MTIAIRFWENVVACGDAPAFIGNRNGETVQLTWRDVGAAVSQWVERLSLAQISSGQRIASWLPNSLNWLAIDLACQTLGCTHVAIDRREPELRMRSIAEHAEVARVICEYELCDDSLVKAYEPQRLLQLSQRVDPNSAAQMLSTSGTSGNVKLVMLSHHNLLGNALAKLDAAPQFKTDLRLNILPWTHAYARTCELSTWILSRSRLAIANDWAHWLALSESLKPTLVNLVPYLAPALLKELDCQPPALGGRLRLLQVGGAGLTEELWQRLAAHRLPPLQGYGLTEASPVVCSNHAGSQRFETVGRAVRGVFLRVDEAGVLWTKSPFVMLGYWRNPEATENAIQAGWLNTGDLVELNTAGVKVLGRQNQQIVLSTGYKVCQLEIEQRMLGNAWLEQALVFSEDGTHLQCLVWPKLAALPPEFFSSNSRTIQSLRKSDWLKYLLKQLAPLFGDLPHYAVPRDIRILKQPLTIEAGTLTLKQTPRRGLLSALATWTVEDAQD